MTSKTSSSPETKPSGLLDRISHSVIIWLLGTVFFLLGIVLTASSGKMLMSDYAWHDAVTTTGRVIITEWLKEPNANRIKITYRYQDDKGNVYHNTGEVTRTPGKISLPPGAPVLVLYKRDDRSQSHLGMELSAAGWLPLMIVGVLEVLAGGLFFYVGARRLKFSDAVSST